MSWQLSLMAVQMRLGLKPLLAKVEEPETARKALAIMADLVFRKPPFLRRYVRGNLHWISAGPCAAGKVVLYFHGGGFIAGSPQVYEGMLGRLALLSGTEICAPVYRLAQETPAPAAYDDAVAAWDQLMVQGYGPSDVVIGGDSAGGCLALALLSTLCQRGTPPAAVFAMSPVVDFAMTGASLQRNRHSEAILPVELFATLRDIVLGGLDAKDPRVSPLYAAFPDCPDVLIQFSKAEILQDDAERMIVHLRGFGADVSVEAVPDAPHVWHMMDGWVPEARASLTEIADFVQKSLAETKR